MVTNRASQFIYAFGFKIIVVMVNNRGCFLYNVEWRYGRSKVNEDCNYAKKTRE